MTKLQRVQNAAARLLTTSRKYDHIKYRIHFKILLLTLKELNGIAPAYISDLINVRKHSRYSQRSNSGCILLHLAEMKKTFGDRSFSVAASTLWNALPTSLSDIDSILKSCCK